MVGRVNPVTTGSSGHSSGGGSVGARGSSGSSGGSGGGATDRLGFPLVPFGQNYFALVLHSGFDGMDDRATGSLQPNDVFVEAHCTFLEAMRRCVCNGCQWRRLVLTLGEDDAKEYSDLFGVPYFRPAPLFQDEGLVQITLPMMFRRQHAERLLSAFLEHVADGHEAAASMPQINNINLNHSCLRNLFKTCMRLPAFSLVLKGLVRAVRMCEVNDDDTNHLILNNIGYYLNARESGDDGCAALLSTLRRRATIPRTTVPTISILDNALFDKLFEDQEEHVEAPEACRSAAEPEAQLEATEAADATMASVAAEATEVTAATAVADDACGRCHRCGETLTSNDVCCHCLRAGYPPARALHWPVCFVHGKRSTASAIDLDPPSSPSAVPQSVKDDARASRRAERWRLWCERRHFEQIVARQQLPIQLPYCAMTPSISVQVPAPHPMPTNGADGSSGIGGIGGPSLAKRSRIDLADLDGSVRCYEPREVHEQQAAKRARIDLADRDGSVQCYEPREVPHELSAAHAPPSLPAPASPPGPVVDYQHMSEEDVVRHLLGRDPTGPFLLSAPSGIGGIGGIGGPSLATRARIDQ